MSLLKKIFHRNENIKERPYHRHCPKGGQTEACDPYRDDPHPLPVPRVRRLSDSLLPKRRAYRLNFYPSGRQKLPRRTKVTSDQDQSYFFSRLPLELRRACYARLLCVAEGTIHIYPRSGKYSYIKCHNPEGLDHQECWAALQDVCESLGGINGTICYGRLTDIQIDTSNFKKTISLNMLFTCRRMYVRQSSLLDLASSLNKG
jgi:hypothetical protein